jgi:hypothetical protein
MQIYKINTRHWSQCIQYDQWESAIDLHSFFSIPLSLPLSIILS